MSSKAWLALQIRRGRDYMVPTLLTAKGYEILAPTYRCRRQWSDRIKEIEAPLFPGYVFCRFDPDSHSTVPVITTPGVLKILGFGGKPELLDETEIESVRLAAQFGLSPRPCQYLSAGSRIRIARGPLCGVEGILTRVKNKELLVISVSMLQRSISVEIERSSIEVVQLGLESQASTRKKITAMEGHPSSGKYSTPLQPLKTSSLRVREVSYNSSPTGFANTLRRSTPQLLSGGADRQQNVTRCE